MTTAPAVMRSFADQLRSIMRAKRVRQWMLAARANREATGHTMTQGRVSDILSGRYPDVRLSTLCRLADAADCDVDIIVKSRES